MKKLILLISTLIIALSCNSQQETIPNKPIENKTLKAPLQLVWETDTLLKTVESVIYDPITQFIYTANINGHFMAKDGNGSIGKLNLKGEIISANWITGLDAPTGLCIKDGKLYTTDIDKVVEIDLAKAEIIKSYPIEGAKALNDITISDDGTLYTSDTGGNKIFSLRDGKSSIWKDNIQTPNGLVFHQDQLLVTQWNPETLSRLPLDSKTPTLIAGDMPQTDGVEILPNGNFLVSSLGGQVHYINKDGQKNNILNTSREGINAADVIYLPNEKMVLVAAFAKHKIMAYSFDESQITLRQKPSPKAILLEQAALSGNGLKAVTNPNQPKRRLFQKRLHQGKEIGVYIVSSETATATWDNYSMDEFIYVINGRARLNPENGAEQFYTVGDFFMAPKGYSGDWETQGGNEFYIEISVGSRNRADEVKAPLKAMPQIMDKAKLSGIGLSKTSGNDELETYEDLLYEGAELDVITFSEMPSTQKIKTDKEQVIYIIAGQLSLTSIDGEPQEFNTGDFLFLPKAYEGEWKTKAHGLFRTLRIMAHQ